MLYNALLGQFAITWIYSDRLSTCQRLLSLNLDDSTSQKETWLHSVFASTSKTLIKGALAHLLGETMEIRQQAPGELQWLLKNLCQCFFFVLENRRGSIYDCVFFCYNNINPVPAKSQIIVYYWYISNSCLQWSEFGLSNVFLCSNAALNWFNSTVEELHVPISHPVWRC